nr:MAG TPA: hypothetical protein [Caudoviricetes sp.]
MFFVPTFLQHHCRCRILAPAAISTLRVLGIAAGYCHISPGSLLSS